MTCRSIGAALRDRGPGGGSNVVRYERRGGRGVHLAGAGGEVMFIDEDDAHAKNTRAAAHSAAAAGQR